MSSDASEFGGWDRISTDYVYTASKVGKQSTFKMYLPARTMCAIKKVKE
jgi:hypothetical protein